MNRTRFVCALAALSLLAIPSIAAAQAIGITPGTEIAREAGANAPSWAMYFDPRTGTYVKPILGLAGGLNLELQRNRQVDGSYEDLEPIKTALAMVIFGVEGRLRDWVSLHLEFRRDAGNYGTSVWEGTISLTALDNYLRLEHWGFKLAGGIVSDPASVDYFSAHMTDLFMADAMSRTPLLMSGYDRGQGLLAQYAFKGLTAGLFFSAGNPLASTASFGFGGNVSSMGSLIDYPRRSISNGNPLAGMELDVLAPSLMYEHKYFEAKANVQLHWVNTNTEDKDDVGLQGELYRLSLKGKIWDNRIQPFANFAYRRNDMILQSSPPDPTQKDTNEYMAIVASGGIDINPWGASGIGANYAYVRSKTGTLPISEQHYLNVGASWWIIDNASLSLRYAKLITKTGGRVGDGVKDKDAFYLVLRLVV
ncbi:MAG TPA: hypothetical protein VGK67_06510 [Myxococcales bacterium]|jgi:hypothetical protein